MQNAQLEKSKSIFSSAGNLKLVSERLWEVSMLANKREQWDREILGACKILNIVLQ